jgi:ACS family tartrate transporter-like MFS transporter
MPHEPVPYDLPATVRRKAAWRILPLVFLLYVIAYLDRANIAYAKLRMATELGWSDEEFGTGFAIFFVGYIFLEIPGALLVEHWSARKWFARILVTWGICSIAMAWVRTPFQFYLARFALGAAEAGFFPGVIVYFTHWFPRAERARAFSWLVFGVPISLVLSVRLAGFLLAQNWFGISGWQWVFIIEGAPAVLMGLAVPFLLTDRPRQARWLSRAEQEWLENTLAQERAAAATEGGVNLRQALRHSSVWLLAMSILAVNTGGYAMAYWLPSIMTNRLHVPAPEVGAIAMAGAPWSAGPVAAVSVLAADAATPPMDALRYLELVYLCGVAGIWVAARSSDRSGERKWHCVFGQILTGVFLAVSLLPGQSFGMEFTWLCFMGFFAYFWPSPFWVLPTQTMSSSAAAVSIGFINICANLGGIFGPYIVGLLRTGKFGDRECMLMLACCYLAGGFIVAALRVHRGHQIKRGDRGERREENAKV